MSAPLPCGLGRCRSLCLRALPQPRRLHQLLRLRRCSMPARPSHPPPPGQPARLQAGLFRYDVTACPTKLVPGAYGFIAQCNEGRLSKKRPTEFRIDQVRGCQPPLGVSHDCMLRMVLRVAARTGGQEGPPFLSQGGASWAWEVGKPGNSPACRARCNRPHPSFTLSFFPPRLNPFWWATCFEPLQVAQDFDDAKFNFKKALQKEVRPPCTG